MTYSARAFVRRSFRGLVVVSYFLGDPPPDPRFLASLGALSLVELDYSSVLKILTGCTGPNGLLLCHLLVYQ
jgi:hypothetical protein